MGIYDRDYYRREAPSYLGSLLPEGIVCKWLIGLNVAFYLLQIASLPSPDVADFDDRVVLQRGDQGLTGWADLNVDEVVHHGQVWRLLSYAFLHDISSGAPYHLLFNMLFLWWFGSDLERLYGEKEFLAFYLTAAFLGGVAYTVWAVSRGDHSHCIGASGAVTALLVLCALHFPTRLIYVFMILPVPIWLFALFEVAQDTFIFASRQQTQTAVVVHLAGAGFAFAYYRLQFRISPLFQGRFTWRLPRPRPKLKVYREDPEQAPEPVAVPVGAPSDEHFEAKLDAVLEKIAKFGKDSLNDGERQILMRASEVYKKKRT